jgi:thioesterase domain-containing protein/acyl carrier protein
MIEVVKLDHLLMDSDSVFQPVPGLSMLNGPPADFDPGNFEWELELQRPEDPVCIMFTSGSTGTPKGVICPLGGIIPIVKGDCYLPVDPEDTILQISAREFDAFTWEIWGALLNGASLFLLPKIWSVSDLGKYIEQGNVTAAFFTARLFDLLLETIPDALAGMRMISFGGEAASPFHCSLARRLLPQTRLINGYGPTENTFLCCSYVLGEGSDNSEVVPIGVPRMGDVAFILDPDTLEPLPGEATGELFVGGPGLAIGYTDLELTKQKFIWHPSLKVRLFRTGDIVTRSESDQYIYRGRHDRQVKFLGHWVNLFDVEQAMCRHPMVRSTHVVLHEVSGQNRLVAFYRTPNQKPVERRSLVDFLSDKVGDYAVPQWFEHVTALPLKPNGKVDVSKIVEDLYGRSGMPEAEDPLERLWARLLYPTPIRKDTHFFKEGGDSLSALNLIIEVEKTFEISLPADYLLNHPVFEEFSRNIGLLSSPSLVVSLTDDIGEHALILVPHMSGSPNSFAGMLTDLRFEGPILSIDMPRLLDDRSIEDVRGISQRCGEALTAFGLKTASLIGPSMGGVIAVDLAAELEDRGIEINKVILLDSYTPPLVVLAQVLNKNNLSIRVWWRRLVRWIKPVVGRDETEFGRHSRVTKKSHLGAKLFAFGPLRYFNPRIPSAKSFVLFSAEAGSPWALRHATDHGWRRLLPNLRVYRVVGTHDSMIDKINGPRLANRISTILGGGE